MEKMPMARRLLIVQGEGRWKMLDAYIIDKLKKERERKDENTWQPIPLPLENPSLGDEVPAKKEKERRTEITFRF